MRDYAGPVEALIEEFRKLPGIGSKSAQRLAFFMIRTPKQEAEKLARVLEITEGPPQAAVRAALSEQRRARSQRAQLERLERSVSVPIRTLPFIFKPRLDVPALKQLAGALA